VSSFSKYVLTLFNIIFPFPTYDDNRNFLLYHSFYFAFFPFFLSLQPFKRTIHSYEIKYSSIKYIETTERGLVVVSVNEADGGRYDCHLGGSLLCSYNITVDAHRYVFDCNRMIMQK
jgi:hypothetical protein